VGLIIKTKFLCSISLLILAICGMSFVSAEETTKISKHVHLNTHAPHNKHKTSRKHKHHLHKNQITHREKVNPHLAAALPASSAFSHMMTSSAPLNHALASINFHTITNTMPAESFITSVENHLISFVHQTVENLHYSSYKLGGTHFDTKHGIYVVDCSGFVDHVLQKIYPDAYSNLVNSTGADNPASIHYYHFFNALSEESDQYWNKIADVEELRPGDIVVFRYKNTRGMQAGGHVMVVMDKPIQVSDVFFVRIADSAPSGHSEDTRQPHTSGIGIGTLLLKANPKTGEPSAYAWGVGGYWNKNVTFAMARPIEMDTSISHV